MAMLGFGDALKLTPNEKLRHMYLLLPEVKIAGALAENAFSLKTSWIRSVSAACTVFPDVGLSG